MSGIQPILLQRTSPLHASKTAIAQVNPSKVKFVPDSFSWPPNNDVGEIQIKFGKALLQANKHAWDFGVTWHKTEGKPVNYRYCQLEDWDKGGHACPSTQASMFVDDALGSRRILSLEEWWGRKEPTHEIYFRRVNTGWLGAVFLGSKDPNLGKGLFLIHLNDFGKVDVGLWVPSQEKFYVADAKSFLRDPNAPLKFIAEKPVPKGAPLPEPFNEHGRNLEEPLGLFPFQHTGQNFLRWEMRRTVDGKFSWHLEEFVLGKGDKTFALPLFADSGTEIVSPSRGIFQKWVREKKQWVSVCEASGTPENFGILEKSRLRLALQDNGISRLSLEEERSNGEKRVYFLDPKWLWKMKDLKILSMKRLMPGETFDMIYAEAQKLDQSFLDTGLKSSPKPISLLIENFAGEKTLGGVAI
jgi:hypothetical protein